MGFSRWWFAERPVPLDRINQPASAHWQATSTPRRATLSIGVSARKALAVVTHRVVVLSTSSTGTAPPMKSHPYGGHAPFHRRRRVPLNPVRRRQRLLAYPETVRWRSRTWRVGFRPVLSENDDCGDRHKNSQSFDIDSSHHLILHARLKPPQLPYLLRRG